MSRSWRVRGQDILDAAERLRSYISGMDIERFSSDPKTVHAVAFRRSPHPPTRPQPPRSAPSRLPT